MQSYFAKYTVDVVRENCKEKKAANLLLLYDAEGECSAAVEGKPFELKAKDLAVINMNETYSLSLSPKTLLCRLSVDYFALCSTLGKGRIFFESGKIPNDGEVHGKLRTVFQDFLLLHLNSSEEYGYQELGTYCLLLSCLTEGLQIKKNFNTKDDADRRIFLIMEYIYENCSGDINLQNIADRLYLSKSAVSRMFYKATGEHLKQYVNRIRLERVAEELVSGSGTVCRIAAENGFASQSSLNREFKAVYGDSPSEYRAKMRAGLKKDTAAGEEKEKIREILSREQQDSENKKKQITWVTGDIPAAQQGGKWENKVLNVGAVYSLAQASLQSQLIKICNRLHTEYIRLWNVFDQRLMLRNGRSTKLNFAKLDEVLDFCVDHHFKLFFDMSPRQTLTMASEKTRIFSKEENLEFQSEQLWTEAMDAFLKHLCSRYGETVVGEWVFEFAYFLNKNPYYIDERYSSRRVWKLGYDLVKSNVPDAKVAGPGLIGTEDKELLELLCENFLDDRRNPDIFTTVIFPYVFSAGEKQEINGFGQIYQRTTERDFFARQLDSVLEVLEEKHFRGKICVTDWGCSVANRNYIQDSCFRASLILENAVKNYRKTDALGIFCASDLLNVFSDTSSILSGSSGIVTRDGICKPVYYTFEFLKDMGRFLIAQNEHALITSESDSDIRILCFNTQWPEMQYYMKEENYYGPEELSRLFSEASPLHLRFKLKTGTRDGMWKIHQKVLNEKSGSILHKWIDFGCAEKLPREDIEYLRQVSVPEICLHEKDSISGILDFEALLKPNEIRFIQLTRDWK
ncbi:MAG TPA: helix-turn-helix domain-containing protein [Lachnospiraceae bacterium]|nr:helix-turn-helix domain-containing protein [Lachnospiraceae bacterium]